MTGDDDTRDREDPLAPAPVTGAYASYLLRLYRDGPGAHGWRVRLESVSADRTCHHFASLEALMAHLRDSQR